MSVATVVQAGPVRHALLAPECDCGGCAPSWARRRGKSRRFAEEVTLAEALLGEDADCHPGMVAEHRECLSALVGEVDRVMTRSSPDDLGYPGVGLSVVMFAGELAAAVRAAELSAGLPELLVRDCEQTVTAAMLTAAECLTGMADLMAAMAELSGY